VKNVIILELKMEFNLACLIKKEKKKDF